MESLIRDQIMNHRKENGLFNDRKFGFLNCHSTVLQLLVVLDKWMKIIEEGGSIDCIYCDFKKAFDEVPHQRLLKKIRGYGITGKILKWIETFLTGRSQQVTVNGKASLKREVTSGISQGSVLGPVLFVIFINDLPDQVDSEIYLFADDTKTFRRIQGPVDKTTLQEDINTMFKWLDKWLLEFHPDICVSMSINSKSAETNVYKMGNVDLKQVKNEKDIGVITDNQLKFKTHMNEKDQES